MLRYISTLPTLQELQKPLLASLLFATPAVLDQGTPNCLTRHQLTRDELMTAFSQAGQVPVAAALPATAAELAKRKPVWVSLTMSWHTHQLLLERSGYEGRSLTNLCAHLLVLGA